MSQAARVIASTPVASNKAAASKAAAAPDADHQPGAQPDESFQQALHGELDRRISELATYSDQTFGPLGAGDWVLTIGLFVLLPLGLVWLLR